LGSTVGATNELASLSVTGAAAHLYGNISTIGSLSLNAAVTLHADTTLTTRGETITFGSTVESDGSLAGRNLTAVVQAPATYYWAAWDGADHRSKTVTGTITRPTDTITLTFTTTSTDGGDTWVQSGTSNSNNYWSSSTSISPYLSTGMRTLPTPGESLFMYSRGDNTLTLSKAVDNIAMAVVSGINGGFEFNDDFEIISAGNTNIGGLGTAGNGYYGSGTVRKDVVADVYELNGSGEINATLLFGGPTTGISWYDNDPGGDTGFNFAVPADYADAGKVVFDGVVGGSLALGALTVNGALDLDANIAQAASLSVSHASDLGAGVSTTGNQSYTGAVTLTANSTLTTTSNGSVTLASTLNGAHALTVSTHGTGDATFTGAVGAAAALSGFSVSTDVLSVPSIDMAANGSMYIANAGASTVPGAITGTNASLTKAGTGTLVLQADNTYSGITTINSGTLQLGNNTATGTVNNSNIVNNATLAFDYSTDVSITSDITNSGSIVVTPRNYQFFDWSSSDSLSNSSFETVATNMTVQEFLYRVSGGLVHGKGHGTPLNGKASGVNNKSYDDAAQTGAFEVILSNELYYKRLRVELTQVGNDVQAKVDSGIKEYVLVSDTGGACLDEVVACAFTDNMGYAGSYNDDGYGLRSLDLNTKLTFAGDVVSTGSIVLNEAQIDGNYDARFHYKSFLKSMLEVSSAGSLTLSSNGVTNAATMTDSGYLLNDKGAVTFNTATDWDYVGRISGVGTLTKAGAGTLTLSGRNDYTGGTSATAGVLKTNFATATSGAPYTISAGALGTGNVVVASGAAVDMHGYSLYNTHSIAGTGVSSSGALFNSAAGAVSIVGATTLTGNASIASQAGGALTYTGAINGAYDLTIDTDGSATDAALTLDTTFGSIAKPTGLSITSGTALVTVSSAVAVAGEVDIAGGDMVVNANVSTATAASGAGSVVLNASGDLTLANAVTVTASANSGVALAAGDDFINNAGSAVAAVSGTGRWVVYAGDTSNNTYGNLNSNAAAVYGETISSLAPAAVASGNRYVFGNTPTANFTITTTDATKVYGEVASLGSAYSVTGGYAEEPGVYLATAVTLAQAYATIPTFVSTKSAAAADVGTAAITVSGGVLNAGFSASLVETGVLTVTARPITITATAASKVYGSVDPSLAATANATATGVGLASVDSLVDVVGTLGRQSGDNVGVYDVTLGTGTKAANYSITFAANNNAFSITPKTLSVSGSIGLDKTYDATTTVVGTGFSSPVGVVTGDTVVVSGSALYSSANAGAQAIVQGSVVLSGADAANYSLSWTDGSGIINKAPLTITANNDAKFVTTADRAGYAGVKYSGFVAGQQAGVLGGSLVLSRSGTDSAAGIYNSVITASGLTANNYDITYVAGDYTIVPADSLLVRVNNTASIYGADTGYTLASVSYLDDSAGAGNEVEVVLGAGTGTVAIDSANTVTVQDGAGAQAVFTLTAASSAYSSANHLKVGGHTLQATATSITGGANFSNNLVIVGSHQVSAKGLTVGMPASASKVYDGSTAVSSLQLSAGVGEMLLGDDVALTGTGTYATRDAGTSKLYTVNGIGLQGQDSNNYYVANGATQTYNNGEITRKPVALAAPPTSKPYDGTTAMAADASVLASLSQQLGVTGDALSGITLTLANASVGTNKQITPSAALIDDGNSGGNYTITYVTSNNAQVEQTGNSGGVDGGTSYLALTLNPFSGLARANYGEVVWASAAPTQAVASSNAAQSQLWGIPSAQVQPFGLNGVRVEVVGSDRVVSLQRQRIEVDWENGSGVVFHANDAFDLYESPGEMVVTPLDNELARLGSGWGQDPVVTAELDRLWGLQRRMLSVSVRDDAGGLLAIDIGVARGKLTVIADTDSIRQLAASKPSLIVAAAWQAILQGS
jgi:autotransporter-associated beta strand protein